MRRLLPIRHSEAKLRITRLLWNKWDNNSLSLQRHSRKPSDRARVPGSYIIFAGCWASLVAQRLKRLTAGDPGSIPGSGRSPGEGNGNPLQYSCLENPMDGGAWWATSHGVAESEMTERLHHHCHYHQTTIRGHHSFINLPDVCIYNDNFPEGGTVGGATTGIKTASGGILLSGKRVCTCSAHKHDTEWGKQTDFELENNRGSDVKSLPAMQEAQVRSLGREGPLKKETATHSSILVRRIPWMEEPGGLQSMGCNESDTTEWLTYMPVFPWHQS